MAEQWFVRPDTVRLDLPSGGGWIEVKTERSIGDTRRAFAAVRSLRSDGSQEIDAELMSYATVLSWLTDWSARDGQGKRVPITLDAVRALRPAVYDEIEAAIRQHADGAAEEKNAPDGEIAPASSSPSAA